MCSKSIKASFLKRKEEFVTMSIGNWLENLKECRAEEGVPEVQSAEEFLKRFTIHYDEPGIDAIDARKKHERIDAILKEIKNPPNNLQLAIA